jgi:S-adenosylhomocysteine hydrolase
MLKMLKQGAVVCNIGHFDNEIDTQYMRDNWTWDEVKPQVHRVFKSNDKNDYLILLSEGRLVNLGNATGHPSRIMDGSSTAPCLSIFNIALSHTLRLPVVVTIISVMPQATQVALWMVRLPIKYWRKCIYMKKPLPI